MMYILQNKDSLEFEKEIKAKLGMMTALVMLRHKGGDTLDDILVYAQKQEAILSNTETAG